MKKIEAIGMYNTNAGFEKYTKAIESIKLWKSEKIIVEKYISKRSKILDLGCGAGRTTFGLYDLGYTNIIGLDLSERLTKYAIDYSCRNNYKIKFIEGDSCSLPFGDNTFDFIIYSFNGLQLIPGEKNRLNVLKESYRTLKNKGYFIFTAHNRDEKEFEDYWLQEKNKWLSCKQDKRLEIFGDMIINENGGLGFIHYSSIDELKAMIQKVGFKIIDIVKRSEIAIEDKNVQEFSSDTYFWILRKSEENEIYKKPC